MSAPLRTALLFCAALSATSIGPARAGPSAEPVFPLETEALPQVAIPNLLDDGLEPELSAPVVEPQIAPQPEIVDEPDEPAVDRGADLSATVAQLRSSDPGSRQLECLAVGIYFEAKGEPLTGQLAVGKVIANRANSGGRFPQSYCGVLFQRGQFSFIRGRALPNVPRSSRHWLNAVAVAKIVDQDLHRSPVGNALFFHARYVSPKWRLKRVASIGNHVFYR
jgi:N-acetylmuramoyl-L-alanine amidase